MKCFILLLGSMSVLFAENKIVYMLSSPRSLSTALFRTFVSRDDFTGFHEPNQPLYDRTRYPEVSEDWFLPNRFRSHSEIKEKFLVAREKNNVIIKDVGFAAEEFIIGNDDFVEDSNVNFVFFIRHPYRCLDSFYKQFEAIFPSYPLLLGTKQLFQMYQHVKKLNPNNVQIVFVEDLLEDPQSKIKEIFKTLDIVFSNQSLSWQSLDDSFTEKSWHEQKRQDLFLKWHGAALKSTQIIPSIAKKLPAADQMFLCAVSNEDRKALFEVYKYHLPYYELFLKEKEIVYRGR